MNFLYETDQQGCQNKGISVSVISQITDSDLDSFIIASDRSNEFARMARALTVFKQNGKEAIKASEREKEIEQDRQVAELE